MGKNKQQLNVIVKLVRKATAITLSSVLVIGNCHPMTVWAEHVEVKNQLSEDNNIFLPMADFTIESQNVGESNILKAVHEGDDHYLNTETTSFYGMKIPEIDKDYMVSDPNEDDWYNALNKMIITPIGDYDEICEYNAVDDIRSEWSNILEINPAGDTENGETQFILRNSDTLEETNIGIESYKYDETEPQNIRVEFVDYNQENKMYEIIFTVDSDVSKTKEIIWYDEDENKNEVIANNDGEFISHLNLEQWKSIHKVEVVDYADNSIREQVQLNYIEIEYEKANSTVDVSGDSINFLDWDDRDINSIFYYYNDYVLRVRILGSTASKDKVKIAINDNTASTNWESDEMGEYTDVNIGNSGKSQIDISAEGYVIFSNEYDGSVAIGDYTSRDTHNIDKVKPVVDIIGNNGSDVENKSITLEITEENFSPLLIDFKEFSVVDITGESLANAEGIQDDFIEAIRSANWALINGKHTAKIDMSFIGEGIFEYSIACKDLAKNEGVSQIEEFLFDEEGPINFKVNYNTPYVELARDTIGFGYYNPEVIIELSAEDFVSGVKAFTWEYTGNDGSKESDEITEIEYSEGGKTATASFTLTANELKQYRGKILFEAIDNVGNTRQRVGGTAHGEGGTSTDFESEYEIVIDTISPKRTVNYPEPQLIRDNDTLDVYEGNNTEYAQLEGTNAILYYNGTSESPVLVDVIIEEANFYPEDVQIIINGTNYSITNWKQDSEEKSVNIGQIELIDDGRYNIIIKYHDRSGNSMEDYQSQTVVVDRTPMVIDKYKFNPTDSLGKEETSGFIDYLEYGYYFKDECTLTIVPLDPVSGVEYVSYRLVSYADGIEEEILTGDFYTKDGEMNVKIPKDFKGQLFVYGYDYAGNRSEEYVSHGMIVDDIAPTVLISEISESTSKDEEGNSLFKEDVRITTTIKDTKSGIKLVQYSQRSEKESYTKEITLKNSGYNVGDDIGDGWIIISMESNLVTELQKVNTYSEDNNAVEWIVSASDSSGNKAQNTGDYKFTIDKTAPIITVDFRNHEVNESQYYSSNRIADITIIERNFDEKLIQTMIENAIGGKPNVTFKKMDEAKYVAEVVFDEGDYTLEVEGQDLVGHEAVVSYSGGNEKLFYVDRTAPIISENFHEFSQVSTGNNFNNDKEVTISVLEHNFDTALSGIQVFSKEPGLEHNTSELVEITDSVVHSGQWSSSGDKHDISFTIAQDAVYQIVVEPVDLAGNKANVLSTGVFEIDQTIPVVEKKNGNYVSSDETNSVDIYTYERKDEPAPFIEFNDTNIAYLKYSLYVWTPNYSVSEAVPAIKATSVYSNSDKRKSGEVEGNKFVLPDFTKDGIYSLEITAVDKAGNESLPNVNTYVRMISQDVLAYIMDSDPEENSGLYSFQYENGTPISMRPDKFKDLNICVFAKDGTGVDTVLRNNNAEELGVDAQVTKDESIYGITMYDYVIKSDFFKDKFSEDTDTDLYLSVKNDDQRIDLGLIHIDGVAPTCVIPEAFRSWNWYFGNEDRSITLSSISEALDIELSKVYNNGAEIPFEYSKEDNTLTFIITKGWNNIGIELSDEAGNTNYIQEIHHIYVGYFWLQVAVGVLIICVILATLLLYGRKRKLQKEV